MSGGRTADHDAVGHVILTVDYEVFGNGTGSVRSCVTEPTDRLLNLARRHSAPVTLFVEALEFAAMREQDAAGGARRTGGRIVEEVEEQLRRAAGSGHDVQLHLHPQWLDARRASDGRWSLASDGWRLGDRTREEVARMVRRGRRYLATTLSNVRSDEGLRVFRAGGWSVQPSAHVVDVLLEEGIDVDSTVAPGLELGDPRRWYDFTGAPRRRPFWRVDREVCSPAEDGALLEVPIAVGRSGLLESAGHLVGALSGSGSKFPEGCKGSFGGEADFWARAATAISKLRGLGMEMLDFCKLSESGLMAVTDAWLATRGAGDGAVPVVAIGHAKTFTRDAERTLDGYLSTMSRRDDVTFSTFGQWIESRGDLLAPARGDG